MTSWIPARLPIRGVPTPELHPSRLAALRQAFGLGRGMFRDVLAWGAGAGEQVIPEAAELPGVRFTAWEADPSLRDRGRESTRAAGLANLDWPDVAPDGRFDLVVSRSALTREGLSMLGWVAERVAPDGVAVLGLAAQPGWQLFSSIRDVLKWHVAHLPAANHAAAARDLVRFLDDALAEESEPHAAWIRAIRLGFDEVDDDWIAREFLAAPIEAFWFHKLVAAAEATGLRWVTEARWHTTAIENFPPSIAEVLAEAEDDVEREQSMDLLRAKAWRQVVLAPYGSARQPEVLVPRESWIQPDFDVREHTDGQSLWVGRSGYALVPDELIGSLLVAGAPGGPVSEIVDASGRGWDEVQLALTRCWRAGVLDVRLTAPPAAEDPAIRLALSALARSGAPLSDRDGRAVDVSPEARAVLGDGIDPAGHLAVLDAPRRAEVLAELRAFGLPTAPDRVL